MRWSLASAALLAVLALARSGEYCDDFEDGNLGPFWTINSDLDSRGHWEASSYQQLKSSIPDFPAPAQGDSVAYLTPRDDYQVYVYARLQMSEEHVFPEGSNISFRYWLRTDYPGSGTLEVRQQIRGVEEKEPLVSLTETSGPNNTQWREVRVSIPASNYGQKIIIFGGCAGHAQNNIAVDDIKICGPKGLDQQCYAISTTELPTTNELLSTETSTTTEKTTAEAVTTEAATTTEESTTWPSSSPAPSAGEYCDDFESGDFGLFWHQSGEDVGGRWEPASYSSLQQKVPDFPPPLYGDTLVYLTLSEDSSFAAGRLEMTAEFVFPEGSSFSFRYWLRSQWPASAALLVKRELGEEEELETLLDLTEKAGPDSDLWREATVTIPADSRPAKIIIFGSCGNEPLDNIAIDDLRICGPPGLNHTCVAASWH